MKIALLISGRAARYEVCLLPILEKSTYHDIDVFMSINDENEDCFYYTEMKKKLHKWLKGLYIQKYQFPTNFNHTHQNKFAFTKINDKWMPFTQMSMYYNDNNAMKMAIDYSKKNNINYDLYMKFRSDIIIDTIPKNLIDASHKPDTLYCNKLTCNFTTHGVFKVPALSDAWVWGEKEIMEKYCDCYNYVLSMLEKTNGDYYIGYEDCITDNIYDKKISFRIMNFSYCLDRNRRIFEKNLIKNCPNISNSIAAINVEDVNSNLNIEPSPYI